MDVNGVTIGFRDRENYCNFFWNMDTLQFIQFVIFIFRGVVRQNIYSFTPPLKSWGQ